MGLETFTPYLSSEAYQWDLSSHTQAVMTLLNTEINPMKSVHFVVAWGGGGEIMSSFLDKLREAPMNYLCGNLDEAIGCLGERVGS